MNHTSSIFAFCLLLFTLPDTPHDSHGWRREIWIHIGLCLFGWCGLFSMSLRTSRSWGVWWFTVSNTQKANIKCCRAECAHPSQLTQHYLTNAARLRTSASLHTCRCTHWLNTSEKGYDSLSRYVWRCMRVKFTSLHSIIIWQWFVCHMSTNWNRCVHVCLCFIQLHTRLPNADKIFQLHICNVTHTYDDIHAHLPRYRPGWRSFLPIHILHSCCCHENVCVHT